VRRLRVQPIPIRCVWQPSELPMKEIVTWLVVLSWILLGGGGLVNMLRDRRRLAALNRELEARRAHLDALQAQVEAKYEELGRELSKKDAPS
jgi:hypothetical protein